MVMVQWGMILSTNKDMIIDFRSSPSSPQPTSVKGQMVESVSSYKYLGLIINKLRFDAHAVCHTVFGGSLLLISVGLFMTMYYKSYIESVLCS